MAAALLPDRLWDLVEPFLPILPRRPQGGRPRVSDRACLTGIVFVLRSGIPWQMLPQELGCGSGMTCWRRLRDWQRAGVWDLMHFALLDWLARSGQIDWSREQAPSDLRRAGRAALGSPDRRQPKRLARGTGAAGCDSATPGLLVGPSRRRHSRTQRVLSIAWPRRRLDVHRLWCSHHGYGRWPVRVPQQQVRIYSLRSAITGFMRDARRAGTKEARAATVSRMRAATVNVGR
jgi:transposase